MLHGSADWRRELRGVGRRPLPDAWTPAVPFKAKAACRRHIPKQQHKVTNWAAYDAALRQRGSLTIWFTDAAMAAWRAEPRTTPGGQPYYSAMAITAAHALRPISVAHATALQRGIGRADPGNAGLYDTTAIEERLPSGFETIA